MPRANRYYISGHIWHLTHRCHKREFLLKFARDRRRWENWLFEVRKRFGLSVLNYVVTSNHVHLLVYGEDDGVVIPHSMQLLAGRTAQEYNQRKERNGAFWDDRYHATAVESGMHLARCMTYISLNMVRCGVVSHPSEWAWCGYHEIACAPKRYARIDRDRLSALLGLSGSGDLPAWQRETIENALARKEIKRCPEWTQALAVGSEEFVEKVSEQLGPRAQGRNVNESQDNAFVLREAGNTYTCNSNAKNTGLSPQNTFLWNITRCQ